MQREVLIHQNVASQALITQLTATVAQLTEERARLTGERVLDNG